MGGYKVAFAVVKYLTKIYLPSSKTSLQQKKKVSHKLFVTQYPTGPTQPKEHLNVDTAVLK